MNDALRRHLASPRRGPGGLTGLLAAALVLLVAPTWGSGCAATRTETAIESAQQAIAQATHENAAKLAPYHYWMARAYLDKAQATRGHAEYWAAQRFAVKARSLAEQSRRDAKQELVRQKIIKEREHGEIVPNPPPMVGP